MLQPHVLAKYWGFMVARQLQPNTIKLRMQEITQASTFVLSTHFVWPKTPELHTPEHSLHLGWWNSDVMAKCRGRAVEQPKDLPLMTLWEAWQHAWQQWQDWLQNYEQVRCTHGCVCSCPCPLPFCT